MICQLANHLLSELSDSPIKTFYLSLTGLSRKINVSDITGTNLQLQDSVCNAFAKRFHGNIFVSLNLALFLKNTGFRESIIQEKVLC